MNSDQGRIELGKKLKAARQKAKLTQAQLAKMADLSVNYYACVERGEENISFSRLTKLEQVLNVKLINI